jgi:uncharacterized membrane protein YjdF
MMKNTNIKKWNKIISLIVRIMLVVSVATGLLTSNFEVVFLSVMTIWLTFFPNIIERRFGVYLPSSLQIVITLFIFSAQYLGELNNFYERFWWWDIMLHTVSGFVLAIIGFMFVYLLNEKYDKNVSLSPFFIVLFSLCFAITIGVFWEFFEFGMDRIFGHNMQKFREAGQDGLVDTMVDLIVDSLGAIIVSAMGYIYIKQKHDLFFTRLFTSWFNREL